MDDSYQHDPADYSIPAPTKQVAITRGTKGNRAAQRERWRARNRGKWLAYMRRYMAMRRAA
jgi:hypothetical protein